MNVQTQGLIAAVFTPMDNQGAILTQNIPAYAAFLAEQPVEGVFVNGTTGEGVSLTTAERKELAAAWAEAVPSSLRMIVHVGHTCLTDAQELAEHAQSVGANGISTIAPFFFRPQSAADLVEWCAAVASAAPRLPYYYYHMPAMSGVDLPVLEFLRLAEVRIPNFAGVKYTFEDLDEYKSCLEYGAGRLDVVFGRDQLLLSALDAGATGAIGSTFNFASPLYQQIIDAHAQGDRKRAEALQQQARKMIEICQAAGGSELAALKSVMDLVGVPCGPVRLPLKGLTAEERSKLHDQLRLTEIFESAQTLPQ